MNRIAPLFGWLATLPLLLLTCTMLLGQREARTSKNNAQLKRMLKRFPESDANKDGVLTFAEFVSFRQKRQKSGAPTSQTGFEKRQHKGDKKTLDYWLLKPKNYDGKKKYPLVLALHGRGGNTYAPTVLGTDQMRDKYPCFIVAPASPKPAVWAIPKGFRNLRGDWTLPQVFDALDELQKEFSIDADRMYVTGQSMGGFGSFGAIVARPKMFAAAVPICGGWNVKDAKSIAHVPLWAFHGAEDRTVPPKWSKQIVDAMKEAGGSPKYTEYPGVGHGSWGRAYKTPELWAWMFAQKRNGS